jgi:hypothetical protein
MLTKLTLTMDQSVVDQAKEYAKKKNRSVSKIVEDYLKNISTNREPESFQTDRFSPITDSISGMFADNGRSYKELGFKNASHRLSTAELTKECLTESETRAMTMNEYNRIKKECFWDLNIGETEIKEMLAGADERAEAFLFDKILQNSTRLLFDLELFKRDVLKELLEKYKVPRFNHDYLFRRKNIAEAYFFDKPLEIEELKWQV